MVLWSEWFSVQCSFPAPLLKRIHAISQFSAHAAKLLDRFFVCLLLSSVWASQPPPPHHSGSTGPKSVLRQCMATNASAGHVLLWKSWKPICLKTIKPPADKYDIFSENLFLMKRGLLNRSTAQYLYKGSKKSRHKLIFISWNNTFPRKHMFIYYFQLFISNISLKGVWLI